MYSFINEKITYLNVEELNQSYFCITCIVPNEAMVLLLNEEVRIFAEIQLVKSAE
jgi:hypothetical protein